MNMNYIKKEFSLEATLAVFDEVEKDKDKINFFKILKLVESGAEQDVKNRRGESLLEQVIMQSDPKIALAFINSGLFDCNALSFKGHSPLVSAIECSGSSQVFKALLDKGADLNFTFERGSLTYTIPRLAERSELGGIIEVIKNKLEYDSSDKRAEDVEAIFQAEDSEQEDYDLDGPRR